MNKIATVAFAFAALTLTAGTDAFAGLKVFGSGKQIPIVGVEKLTVPIGRPLGQKAGPGVNVRPVPFGLIPAIHPKSRPAPHGQDRATDAKAKATTDIATVRGSKVSGTVNQGAVVGETVNIAAGKDADAGTEIAVVRDSRGSGKATQGAVVRRNTNLARGTRAKATTRIAVVEDTILTGTATQTATVDSSANFAEGTDAKAATHIGTISGSTVSGDVGQSAAVARNVNLANE